MAPFEKATKKTMYFIGVTTGKSSIMKVFPQWARYLDLGDVAIKGIDFVPHSDPQQYREVVAFIKEDPLSCGALVTTPKIDLFKVCRDLFDNCDEYAESMGEASSISKHDGKLWAHAKDPITAGLAPGAFLPGNYWQNIGAQTSILGAGGSSLALSWYLLKKDHGTNRPSKGIIANRSVARLDEMKSFHAKLRADIPLE